MKEETQPWIRMADTDLAAADVLLQSRLFAPAAYHCQQAVEKLLKAFWVETHDEGLPPRTHDLLDLVDVLQMEFPEWEPYLARLSEQAVAARYIDPSTFPETLAIELVSEAKKLCALLLQKLTS